MQVGVVDRFKGEVASDASGRELFMPSTAVQPIANHSRDLVIFVVCVFLNSHRLSVLMITKVFLLTQ